MRASWHSAWTFGRRGERGLAFPAGALRTFLETDASLAEINPLIVTVMEAGRARREDGV